MRVLENLNPKIVFHYFEDLAGIPHGSTDTKKISDYCVRFAKEHGLVYYQDKLNNVIIIKEATRGYENSPGIIIQGHLDMVCEKITEDTIDFLEQGLTLDIDGDYLFAKDTSLGGDDGIAIAMALAVLASNDLKHPRIEAVFTVDEEIGMLGAAELDVSVLTAKKFLNIDSEAEGVFTVSCAGGVTAESNLPILRQSFEGTLCKLSIKGLMGGHSGVEIHKGRGNANVLMGRLLYTISKKFPFRINALAGGQKDNVITNEASSEILLSEDKFDMLQEIVLSYHAALKHEFKTSDPGVAVTLEKLQNTSIKSLDEESTKKIIFILMNFPRGIQSMSMDIDGLVQTSLNLGILKLSDNNLSATFAVRSSVETELSALTDRLTSITEYLGGTMSFTGRYPAWEFKKDSSFRDTLTSIYKKQYGESPKIEAIHAGLECGLFSGKIKDLDCVSIGPDMSGVHSVNERLSISSVERVWKFLTAVLEESK